MSSESNRFRVLSFDCEGIRGGFTAAVLALIGLFCLAGFADAIESPDRPFSLNWTLRNRLVRSTYFANMSTGWVVGESGTILATRDGGEHWQAQSSGTQNDLASVHFADPRVGWAVGANGTILATRDAGEHWQPQSSGTNKNLYGVQCADARTGWVVGQAGTILATLDGGEHWQVQSSGTRNNLIFGVQFVDAHTGWAVGDRGIILATGDGGEHWHAQSSGTQNDLASVHFVDVSVGWAVGADETILATRDGGKHWQAQSSGTDKIPFRAPSRLYGVDFADGRTGWAVGEAGTILATRDGGEHWQAQSNGTNTYLLLFSVHFANARVGWAVGEVGTILATRDGGEHWQAQSGGAISNLFCVYFADAQTGWAVGDNGTILATRNGGEHWQIQASDTQMYLRGVHFADARTGWAVGEAGTILATRDGGEHWQTQSSGVRYEELRGVHFVDGRTGWVVGVSGTILATRDGGEHWQAQSGGTQKYLRDVYFADTRTGWAVGVTETILVTRDSGEHWEVQFSGKDIHPVLLGVHFADARTGWAVGEAGTILATGDGGEHWQAQSSGTQNNLWGVDFADARTGWVVGEMGTILATRDGGEHWQVQVSGTQEALTSVHFAGARTGCVVGTHGCHLQAGPPIYAPWIDKREATAKNDLTGNVEVSFLVHTESGQTVSRATVQYKTKEKPWEPLDQIFEKPDPDGRWRIKWNPGNLGLATNQDIAYRVRLDDGRPPLAPFELGVFSYQPWWATAWQDYRTQILGLAGVMSLLVAYLGAFGIMLWLAPSRLAGIADVVGIEEIKKPEGSLAILVALLQRAIQSIVLPWFVRHPRVRRSWIRLYLDGKTNLEQLSKPARESFLNATDFLDAWVQARLLKVRAALDNLDLVKQRRTYVAVPVRVNDAEAGEMIDQPSPKTLRRFFALPRAIVSIVGDGGSGKTTLACAVAHWAMAGEERLLDHPMLPVVIAEDSENLLESIQRNLRRMLGEEELPNDLLRGLLAKQRILVIVDALSEREPATQHHVETLYDQGLPINALVITSRRDPDLKAVDRTSLRPEHLTGERLIPFIFEYLRRQKLDHLFPPRQQVQLGERVLALAESEGQSTSVTPLLVTLFVGSAISRAGAGSDLAGVPDQIPEVFLDYLRRLNPTTGDPSSVVPNEELIHAACCLAIASLGDNFIPSDFEQNALLPAAISRPITKVIHRLVANGVLEQREVAGIALLRFSLDPAAEYLAAIGQIRSLRSDGNQWESFLRRVQNAASYPTECSGFLLAVSVCYKTYLTALRLPVVNLPWEPGTISDATLANGQTLLRS